MDKRFGETLKYLIGISNVKEKDLAKRINYDITSVSKWVNGAKLPSSRNAAEIIRTLAGVFAQTTERAQETLESELRQAWESDRFYREMQIQGQQTLSFLDNRKEFFDLLKKLFGQIGMVNAKELEIRATFDLLKMLGQRFFELLQELSAEGMRKIRLDVCMDMEEAAGDHSLYCETLLNMVAGYEEAQVSIVQTREHLPWILTAGRFLYVQVLYPEGDDFSICFSMDRKLTERFENLGRKLLDQPDRILNCASPENLRKTNVQLDSYSCQRQRLFFNEAPAMLLPPEVMEAMIEASGDQSYREYLRKLKKIFCDYTYRAQVDLMLFSSVITEYIMTGEMSLGNVAHHLTPEQVRAHIEYLARCMEENADFHLYVLKDTAGEERRPPSIFIDSNAVTIENSKRKPNENYHISMYPQMIRIFENYYDDIKKRPNCVELTAEELRRYL